MRSAATTISISDPWLAWAAMVGLAPSSADGSGDTRTLPLLAVGAMILGTLLLGLVRRRLTGVLETWRRDARASSHEGLRASASRSAD